VHSQQSVDPKRCVGRGHSRWGRRGSCEGRTRPCPSHAGGERGPAEHRRWRKVSSGARGKEGVGPNRTHMNFKEDGKESESLGKIVGSAFGKPQGGKNIGLGGWRRCHGTQESAGLSERTKVSGGQMSAGNRNVRGGGQRSERAVRDWRKGSGGGGRLRGVRSRGPAKDGRPEWWGQPRRGPRRRQKGHFPVRA
jgi:hypothetical protein